MPPTTTTTTTSAAAAFSLGAVSFFSSSPRESRVCKHPRKVPLAHLFVLPRAGNDITASKEGPFVRYLYKAAHHASRLVATQAKWVIVSPIVASQPQKHNDKRRSRSPLTLPQRAATAATLGVSNFSTHREREREYNPPKFNIEIVSSDGKKEKGFVSR